MLSALTGAVVHVGPVAERWHPRGLGPAPSPFCPLRDLIDVGARCGAQQRHGLSLGLVLRALALGGAQRDPGHLGQQVAAVAGYLLRFGYSGGPVGFGHGAPPGMAGGRAGQPGHDQPVSFRS